MNLEQQVCTLEQAKRLKELEVTAPGVFMWHETGDVDEYAEQATISRYDFESFDMIGIAIAYTASELAEMLSSFHYSAYGVQMLQIYSVRVRWHAGYRNPINFTNPEVESDSLSQTLAALLIHLLSTNLLTAERCNAAIK